MQSQSTEVQQNEPVKNLAFQYVSSAQHGLWNDLESSSTSPLPREAGEESPQQVGDTDTLSVTSGGSGRGRQSNIGWLKRHGRSSHEVSPVNRIEEYERAHLSSKRDDDVYFQVIPCVKGVKSHISVEQFPNGKSVMA